MNKIVILQAVLDVAASSVAVAPPATASLTTAPESKSEELPASKAPVRTIFQFHPFIRI